MEMRSRWGICLMRGEFFPGMDLPDPTYTRLTMCSEPQGPVPPVERRDSLNSQCSRYVICGKLQEELTNCLIQ